MSTLTVMKARIASELARSNLTDQIAAAITTAITQYQKERFRFSDISPTSPPTFNTVVGRSVYTSADNANISTLYNFDFVLATISGTIMPLTRSSPAALTIYNQVDTMHGDPMWYAYEGNELILSPVPAAVYPITLGVFRRVAAPASDAEADNPWMTDGELLIRSRAKYEIATHVTRNPVMAAEMSPLPPPPGVRTGHAAYFAWKALKGEANRVTSLGRVRPMAF